MGSFPRGIRGRKVPLAQRFWEKVDRSGGPSSCWRWLAAKRPDGYGIVRGDGPRGTPCNHKAHRVAWKLTIGPIPDDMQLCHRCDNPPCVNPAHLFLGTNADNRRDSAAKGRTSRGIHRPNAKLSEATVRRAREAYSEGVGVSSLARQFGVAIETIRPAVLRQTWKHVS